MKIAWPRKSQARATRLLWLSSCASASLLPGRGSRSSNAIAHGHSSRHPHHPRPRSSSSEDDTLADDEVASSSSSTIRRSHDRISHDLQEERKYYQDVEDVEQDLHQGDDVVEDVDATSRDEEDEQDRDEEDVDYLDYKEEQEAEDEEPSRKLELQRGLEEMDAGYGADDKNKDAPAQQRLKGAVIKMGGSTAKEKHTSSSTAKTQETSKKKGQKMLRKISSTSSSTSKKQEIRKRITSKVEKEKQSRMKKEASPSSALVPKHSQGKVGDQHQKAVSAIEAASSGSSRLSSSFISENKKHSQDEANPENIEYLADEAFFVISLQGVKGAHKNNDGRLDKFYSRWQKSCNETQTFQFRQCAGVPDQTRGEGITKAYIECLGKAMKTGAKRLYFFEDDAEMRDTRFCSKTFREDLWKRAPDSTFLLLLGAHTIHPSNNSQLKAHLDKAFQATRHSFGLYAITIPLRSAYALRAGFEQDVYRGGVLDPDVALYHHGRRLGGNATDVIVTAPTLFAHAAGWSNTWSHFRPKIVGR
ncbi:unnamed protein product [Amoebophrya sp. A25]|nr:unnamed protein product [Amoebophrya sp. A25]|eukprot:GSA25T00007078001.1